VAALESSIDDLYKLPLGEFTAARNALAKSLKGDEAKRIRGLVKPTAVPWAVNQVYWRARGAYDRLMKSGEKLRAAQIAALEGRATDVRAAGDAHRRAIGDAVAEAERLAAASGTRPGTDALSHTFESLSLAASAPGSPGRLTDVLQPAGFEALSGLGNLELRAQNSELKAPKLTIARSEVEPRTKNDERLTKAAAAAAAKEAARLEVERKQYEAAVKKAEEHLGQAEAAERKAREVWERAHDDLLSARQTLTDLRRSRFKT
jgi:hypothetical protein